MRRGQSSLRYVGSPYQTSLSEAGQDKFLYCLSCSPLETNSKGQASSYRWKEEERWTLNIGKKYFKALSLKDPIVNEARSGDRVVIPVRPGEEAAADTLLRSLGDRGVEVEVRRERSTLPSRRLLQIGTGKAVDRGPDDMITSGVLADGTKLQETSDGTPLGDPATAVTDASDLSHADPMTIFETYMAGAVPANLDAGLSTAASVNTTKDAVAGTLPVNETDSARLKTALQEAVLVEGRATLDRLMSASTAADGNTSTASASLSAVTKSAMSGGIRNLQLDSVSLHNFGPYGGPKVMYPLSRRGLVLIRGDSTDRTGADSNGAGKVHSSSQLLNMLDNLCD